MRYKHFTNDPNVFVNLEATHDQWCELFQKLAKADVFATMLVVMGYLDLVTDSGCPQLNTPYAQSCAWIGELMADAEREEIYNAAEKTGLLACGMNDFAQYALSSEERKRTYAPTVKEIISEGWYVKYLEPHVTEHCIRELF